MENEHYSKHSLTWSDLDSSSFMINSTLYVLTVDLFLYPSDLLATRLQADKFGQGRVQVRRLFMDIFRREGVRVAGAVSETTAALTYLPTDIVTQRLQVQSAMNSRYSNKNSSASRICNHIYQTEGIKGFYRGFGPYILVYGPGSAVWWASYEACKSVIFGAYRWAGLQVSDAGSYHQGGSLKIMAHLVSGGFAGAAGYVAVNPLEVAKTRLQLLEFNERTDKRALSSGYCKLLRDVFVKEGIAGLYKGLKPRLLIRVPVSSVAFIGYEYMKESSMKTPDSGKGQ